MRPLILCHFYSREIAASVWKAHEVVWSSSSEPGTLPKPCVARHRHDIGPNPRVAEEQVIFGTGLIDRANAPERERNISFLKFIERDRQIANALTGRVIDSVGHRRSDADDTD